MNDFQTTKALVKSILDYPFGGRQWSVQGLGMLRTYVTKELRLHLWNPALEAPGASKIHTHPWDLHSTVLSGHIVDRVYRSWAFGTPTHWRQRLRCGVGGCLVEAQEQTRLGLWTERTIETGESYLLASHQIHESAPAPGTATLVKRTFVNKDEDLAYVFDVIGKPWGSAEPRPATEAEVQETLALALKAW